jgi:3-methyladenine DNA glycosylase AlkD
MPRSPRRSCVTTSGASRADAARPMSLEAEIAARIAREPGATVPGLRRIRREFSREVERADGRTVVRAAIRLAQVAGRGHRFVAYELVRHHDGAAGLIDARALARLGRGMDSWDAVDCFGIYLSGPAWQRRRVSDGAIHGWARSPDVWWRRAALVSTVPLNSRAHGGKGDVRRTLRVCRMLESDREPMVVKALSWALRELAKREPAAVRAFLGERRGRLAALVVREVRNKLETGLKNPRR